MRRLYGPSVTGGESFSFVLLRVLCGEMFSPMILQINGEARDFSGVKTLSDLVEHLGIKGDRVAIELNLDIVPRDRWTSTQLHDGDRLEIVHFVGGGKSPITNR